MANLYLICDGAYVQATAANLPQLLAQAMAEAELRYDRPWCHPQVRDPRYHPDREERELAGPVEPTEQLIPDRRGQRPHGHGDREHSGNGVSLERYPRRERVPAAVNDPEHDPRD